jgi:hypothetical protein
MNFGEMPKDLNEQEKNRLNNLANELDKLYQSFIKKRGIESLPYVDWIIQDLRKGDLKTAKINYEQQGDKYEDKPEIKKFLEDNGIAEKGIDWDAWKNSDSDDYFKNKKQN